MKIQQKRFYLFSLGAVLCLSAGLVLFYLPLKRCLVIDSMEDKKLIAYIELGKTDSFQIQYTHSIHLSEVKESYRIKENNDIEQVELMYSDTAIGMPANAEKGETFEMKDGEYFIRNMKREFPFIPLSVGQVAANHRLLFQGKVYPLKNYVKPGSIIKIDVRKLSIWDLWKGVNILGKR
ncbi:DUF1850 domain-containing protein [Falsibacillus pallidus]|uniref:DUF1850 domain-containing protein n=1 Tax=Falsibacillus pallidus TaxID=493781 RepID=UPI003D99E2E7